MKAIIESNKIYSEEVKEIRVLCAYTLIDHISQESRKKSAKPFEKDWRRPTEITIKYKGHCNKFRTVKLKNQLLQF